VILKLEKYQISLLIPPTLSNNIVNSTICAGFLTKEINFEGESGDLLIWDTDPQEV
jgi:hypothetical protein